MKKSQLKNIIKEEIQRLQEQTSLTPPQLLNEVLGWLRSTGTSFDWRCFPTQRSWLIGIFTLGPFNSTNPNQPCNFIQNKINQLQTWINNFSGNPNSQQLAIKTCKLQAFQAMLPWAQSHYGC